MKSLISKIAEITGEENLIIDFEYAIEMKAVAFTEGIAVKEDNMC